MTGNIHVMRESLSKLLAVMHSPAPQDVDWTTMIENSRWLTHNRLLLNAAFRAAHHVHREQASVLVHCSHGWDRSVTARTSHLKCFSLALDRSQVASLYQQYIVCVCIIE